MAMSWSDRASSPNNRTSPDSVQATAAEEEAHKHGPFYRNPGKTGDKQSSQPSAPRSNTGSHHVPYRPISDKHFPPKPLSTRRQKKGTAQNTPPANDDKQPRETSLKPEPNIIAILVAAIGIIPPLPRSSAKREREDGSPSIERLRDRGFLVLTDPSQLDTLSRGPVMGFFADGHLPKMSEGRGDYLERAIRKALEILLREAGERDRGFVLMVEGSQIDLRAHDNDAEGVLTEMRDFDRAVAAAMDFADRHPGTLVVVTADHETGGLSIPSTDVDFEHGEAGIEYRFSTGGHTAAMVPVYLYGTGAERINGVLDNTELAHMLKRQVLPDNRRSVSAMKIKSSKIIHLIHKTVRSYFCQACR